MEHREEGGTGLGLASVGIKSLASDLAEELAGRWCVYRRHVHRHMSANMCADPPIGQCPRHR